MSECIKLATCSFFNDRMAGMEGMGSLFKRRFCQGDHSMCARWRVASANLTVPADLFPNQSQRADEILAQAGKR